MSYIEAIRPIIRSPLDYTVLCSTTAVMIKQYWTHRTIYRYLSSYIWIQALKIIRLSYLLPIDTKPRDLRIEVGEIAALK